MIVEIAEDIIIWDEVGIYGLPPEMREFSKGWDAAICKAMALVSSSSILSPIQKKLLWKEVKKLKGV